MNLLASGVSAAEQLLAFTLLQLALIILAARGAGNLACRLRQPRAVGEIVAGLLLGPSLLGAVAPVSFHWLFHSVDGSPLTVISQIGLILLMFQVGLEFDFAHLRDRRSRRAAVAVTAAGILCPFGLGLGYGWLSAPTLAPAIDPLAYSLFIAIALSITAVPILGRIMLEFDLHRSRLGVITITAAAANDAIGWVLLALVAAVATDRLSWLRLALQVGLLLGYLVIAWLLVRPLLLRLLRHYSLRAGILPQSLLAWLLAVIFGSALLTSRLGIFAIFGGFLTGVLLHDQTTLVRAWKNRVEDLVSVFFLPIFFTYTGLRTDIGELGGGVLWGWFGLLLGLAVLGKFGGCYAGARCAGLTAAESRNIAIMMNTRALMELIVVNLGFDLGVIPRPVFTMLVLMALISTVMTAPGLRLWLPATGHRLPGVRDR